MKTKKPQDRGPHSGPRKSAVATNKNKVFKSKALTRKERRKEERKNKKVKRQQFALRRAGKILPEEPASGNSSKKDPKKSSKKQKSKQRSEGMTASTRQEKVLTDLKKEEAKLKKEMEAVRRKRLLEENEEEEKTIRQLEKKLKLNKKAIIPASFRTDGLDYLLEVCHDLDKKSKSKKGGKSQPDEPEESEEEAEMNEDDYGEDEIYSGEEQVGGEGGSDDSDAEEDLDEVDDEGGENFSEGGEAEESFNEGLDDVDLEEEGSEGGLDEDSAEEEENFDGGEGDEEELGSMEDDDEEGEEKDAGGKEAQVEEQDSEYWEDIYGRLRTKDGAVVDERAVEKAPKTASGTKYVPPALRGNQTAREKLRRSLKGLLNRLAESNMHSISQQVEQMYMYNSRNEMNEALLDLYFTSLVLPTVMSERIVLEHAMLIAILHANVGSEIGAYFLQEVVKRYRQLYDETENLEESKELQNICLLLAGLYHFKIVDCSLIFEVLNLMGKNFQSKDVELILAILKMIGFRLRKDDPVQLKNFIIFIQQQAARNPAELSDSRVKFMLEILLAIRNNNVNKIPNYDPSFGEHCLKMLKQHLHKGNYVTELKIGMQDLLDADTKGRWWIVGSAWSNEASTQEKKTGETFPALPTEQAKFNQKLLKKAKKFGMNTDIRRNVFCVLMSAEDYLDAFEKLMHLGLKNQQERELVHVTVYCCLHEKKYNPYYALVLSKLCSEDRKYMYPAPLKLEVVEFAKILGQRKASRLFRISQKRIFEWLGQEQTLRASVEGTAATPPSPSTRSTPGSRQSSRTQALEGSKKAPEISSKSSSQIADLEAETEVYNWFLASEPQPTSTQIRKKAVEVYRSKGHKNIKCSYGWYRRWCQRFKCGASTGEDSDPIILSWLLKQYDNNNLVSYADLRSYGQRELKRLRPDFKGSPGWATRFFKRHHVFLNWEGIQQERLPQDLELEIDHFLQETAKMNLATAQTGCMDEIPLSFAGSKSKDCNSTRASRLKKTSIRNCDATVILSLRADGVLLPPMIVVKAQNSSSLNQVYTINDNPVIVFYSKTTEPTLFCLEKWLELVWMKSVSGGVLFWDSYELHSQLESKCKDAGVTAVTLPAGCSCKLQPLNFLARMKFNKILDKCWEEYVAQNANISPSPNEIVEWVTTAYNAMRTDTCQRELRESFEKVGLGVGNP